MSMSGTRPHSNSNSQPQHPNDCRDFVLQPMDTSDFIKADGFHRGRRVASVFLVSCDQAGMILMK